MKLLEVEIRKAKTKEGKKSYTKFIVTIPNEIIEKLEWKKGMELDFRKMGSGILIKKRI